MRVLLISANTETINMPVLPLGLACVDEAARSAGHDVKLVDLMDQQDTRLVLKDAVDGFQPEIIGISVRNIDDQCMENPGFLLDLVKDFVNDCRSLSDAPIILGGAGYSIFPESALAYLGADMGIQGEGEIAFTILLERLSQKADLSGIPGLYLPDQGIQGKVRFTKDLDECPLPLPGVQQWTSLPSRNEEIWLPFQTRRGCPLNCSYCSTPTIEGKIMRKHSLERVVDAISRYVEAGFDRFFFVDNIFNLPLSYAKEFCDQLVEAGLNTSWRCILYPWRVDEELVEKMAEAGCKEVSLGFESGSEKILRAMNKNFQPEEVRRISERLKHYGIQQMGFLLLGGPEENRKTVEESLAFADSLDLEAMKITMGIRIYPHTDLARTAIKEGVIAPDDDLLFPKFYMTPDLDEWLRSTVSAWMDGRPHWML
ncbi:MAG: radical SAM protein [Desulfobacteraceae bacterium]|nr:radical SAM protein [Desulfobacteraceae bacterium]